MYKQLISAYENYEKFDIIDNIINNYDIKNGMNSPAQHKILLELLKSTLDNNIEGDIVELGCHEGQTTLLMTALLNQYDTNKQIHVYDSFEGLPQISNEDKSKTDIQFKKGDCITNIDNLITNFNKYNLTLPIINRGWFKDIPDEKYPSQISFAHFDGDLYSSIMDSFNKVYHKMSKGGIIIIDDYNWDALPGVKKATDDFLRNKPEFGSVVDTKIGKGIMKKL